MKPPDMTPDTVTIASTTDPLLTLREVQGQLNVSRITLFRWIRSGRLTAVKVGRDWRVRSSVVEAMKGEA